MEAIVTIPNAYLAQVRVRLCVLLQQTRATCKRIFAAYAALHWSA